MTVILLEFHQLPGRRTGKYIAQGDSGGVVQVWEMLSGKLITYFKQYLDHIWGHGINSLAWSSGGKYIVSCDDYTVQVWEALTGNISYSDSNGAASVAWSPDGKYIAIGSPYNSMGSNTTAQVVEAKSGKRIADYTELLGYFGSLISVSWSPDGKYIAIGGSYDDNNGNSHAIAQVLEAKSGRQLLAFDGHTDAVFSVAWSPDGKYIASGSYDETVQVWEA